MAFTGISASTASNTNIATFGADNRSLFAGNSETVAWTLTNDPRHAPNWAQPQARQPSSVTVGAKAGLTVAATSALSSVGTNFASYTGSTALTYYIRTTQSTEQTPLRRR